MNDLTIWLAMAGAIVGALGAEFLASRIIRKRAYRDDFDGGFTHDNVVHVTRIRSPYIVSARKDQ